MVKLLISVPLHTHTHTLSLTVLGSPSVNHATTFSPAHNTPLHTVTMPFNISPALISPSQVQALISQFHSPISQIATTNMSHDRPTQSHDREVGTPLTVQSVTIASDPAVVVQDTSSPTPQDEGAGLTQLGSIVLNSSQLQSLVSQIQVQQKLTGEGIHVINTLPGYSTVTTE